MCVQGFALLFASVCSWNFAVLRGVKCQYYAPITKYTLDLYLSAEAVYDGDMNKSKMCIYANAANTCYIYQVPLNHVQ